MRENRLSKPCINLWGTLLKRLHNYSGLVLILTFILGCKISMSPPNESQIPLIPYLSVKESVTFDGLAAQIPVVLDKQTTIPVSVKYATSDRTARAGRRSRRG